MFVANATGKREAIYHSQPGLAAGLRNDQQHHDQREDHQRFDEHQTENHRQRNAFERARVASQTFASGCADAALAESAQTGGDTESDHCADVTQAFGQTASASAAKAETAKNAIVMTTVIKRITLRVIVFLLKKLNWNESAIFRQKGFV